MSNFIPNEVIKTMKPRDPPWINKQLKTLLKRFLKGKTDFLRMQKNGFKEDDLARLNALRIECKDAIEVVKSKYFQNLGSKLHNPEICQKSYWKIINKVMNKSAAPKIPPLLHNNSFILNCREKARIFNDFFCNQCKLVVNNSILPGIMNYHTDRRLNQIEININDIVSLLRKINPNKETSSDEISGKMLLLCEESVALPLQIIFKNILHTSGN